MGRKPNRWAFWDYWMRTLHLYTGLFLSPWMVVYAISAFNLNHSPWFTDTLKLALKWEEQRRIDFYPDASFPVDPKEQGQALLEYIDLAGPFRIQGEPNSTQMILYRPCATGPYRVTWQRQQSKVIVDRFVPASFYSYLNNLHFQHRYDLPAAAYVTWAIVVDLVTSSTILWVASGIYLWARKPRKRTLGGIFLLAGCALFTTLAILLCA
jgi:hypothetical protein